MVASRPVLCVVRTANDGAPNIEVQEMPAGLWAFQRRYSLYGDGSRLECTLSTDLNRYVVYAGETNHRFMFAGRIRA